MCDTVPTTFEELATESLAWETKQNELNKQKPQPILFEHSSGWADIKFALKPDGTVESSTSILKNSKLSAINYFHSFQDWLNKVFPKRVPKPQWKSAACWPTECKLALIKYRFSITEHRYTTGYWSSENKVWVNSDLGFLEWSKVIAWVEFEHAPLTFS